MAFISCFRDEVGWSFSSCFIDQTDPNQHGFWVQPEQTGWDSAIYLKTNVSSRPGWMIRPSTRGFSLEMRVSGGFSNRPEIPQFTNSCSGNGLFIAFAPLFHRAARIFAPHRYAPKPAAPCLIGWMKERNHLTCSANRFRSRKQIVPDPCRAICLRTQINEGLLY